MREKRISFNEYHTANLYEMAMEHMCPKNKCCSCDLLRSRIEKFLGKKHVERIRGAVKKRPYCTDLGEDLLSSK